MADRSNRNMFGPTVGIPLINSGDYIGMWSSGLLGPLPGSQSGANRIAVDGNNVLTVIPIFINAPITISKFTFQVGTLSAGQTANFGIYDILGNKKFDSGPISCTLAVVVTGTGVSVTLQPGEYFFAQSCTDGVATSASSLTMSTSAANLANQNKRRVFIKGTNLTVAGVMPATLGAIQAGLGLAVVCGWFE